MTINFQTPIDLLGGGSSERDNPANSSSILCHASYDEAFARLSRSPQRTGNLQESLLISQPAGGVVSQTTHLEFAPIFPQSGSGTGADTNSIDGLRAALLRALQAPGGMTELTPVVERPVMYAQAGGGGNDLPDLPPPVQTDTPAGQAGPPRIEIPGWTVSGDVLAAVTEHPERLASLRLNPAQHNQVRAFLARELCMALITDAFVERRAGDPPNPRFLDLSISSLEQLLTRMRQASGTGWQVEAAITQGLLGFAQLHRAGLERLRPEDVARAQQDHTRQIAGGQDNASFANAGLRNLLEARRALERLLNPPAGTPALPMDLQREIRRILGTLPNVTEQGGQLRLTQQGNSDELIQVGMRHGRLALSRLGIDVR